jgi:yecA family protein
MTTKLDDLDLYLSSDQSPADSFGLSDLDGFLTGVACCPEHIPVLEWLDVALGSADMVPGRIVAIVTARYAEIKDLLQNHSESIEPIFWESPEGNVIAMDWCEGFMEAVKLRPERWEAFSQSDKGAQLMMPILVHMFDDQGNSLFGLAQEDIDEVLDQAAEAIPKAVPAVYRHLNIIARQ